MPITASQRRLALYVGSLRRAADGSWSGELRDQAGGVLDLRGETTHPEEGRGINIIASDGTERERLRIEHGRKASHDRGRG